MNKEFSYNCFFAVVAGVGFDPIVNFSFAVAYALITAGGILGCAVGGVKALSTLVPNSVKNSRVCSDMKYLIRKNWAYTRIDKMLDRKL